MPISTPIFKFLTTGLIGFIILVSANCDGSLASQFSNGKVVFDKAPRLLDAVTTFNSVRAWGATYYFTIELPKEANEPLQKVIITQRQGSEDIDFLLDKTIAVEGSYGNKGEQLNLQTVDRDEKTGEITVVFDSPVPPGTTFSIGLKPTENPFLSGVYLFGITVFPIGKQPSPLYLGVGRLDFYSGGDSFGF
ncbi:MAG: DUF2808 domain-containing protein [Xenococcaceae cyanobacterium]